MNVVRAMLASNLLQPVVWLLQAAIALLNDVVHNFGWTMVILAVLVRAVF